MGFGTFSGYAIDVETGERLKIMFGEDSSDKENNGIDMFWNPTTPQEVTAVGTVKSWGGSHFCI